LVAAISALGLSLFYGGRPLHPLVPQDLRDAPRSDDRLGRASRALEGAALELGGDFAPAQAPEVGASAQVAAGARSAGRADLSREFPDRPNRNQSDIGSCHDFATVALLEAAIFRKTGSHERLSEADIFLTRTLASEDAYKSFIQRGETSLREGNFLSTDLSYALRRGIATSLDYSEFYRLYDEFRDAETPELKRLNSRLQRFLPYHRNDPGFAEAKREFYADDLADTSLRPKVVDKVHALWPGLEGEREATAKLLSGVVQEQYPAGGPPDWRQADASACAEKAKRLEGILRGYLDAGIPMGIDADIGGMDSWKNADSGIAAHGFLFVGYEASSDGTVLFKTRNSWAGLNPDFKASDLCRVRSLHWVLTPAEQASRR